MRTNGKTHQGFARRALVAINYRSSLAVSLAHRVSVSIPEFSSLAQLALAIFRAALFRASRFQPFALVLERSRLHRAIVPARVCDLLPATANPGR